MKRFSLRCAVMVSALTASLASGVLAQAQDSLVTANTFLSADIHGSLYIGVNAIPPGQTRNTNPAVEISGISVSGNVQTFNTSTFDLAGGNIGGNVQAHNRSVVNVSGGIVESEIIAFDTSTVNISGGDVFNPEALNDSTINIRGGAVEGILFAVQNSVINISGGQINAVLNVFQSGRINLFGTDLRSVLTDPHATGDFSKYTLSGHLLDGSDVTGKQIMIANGEKAAFTLNNPPSEIFLMGDALLRTSVPEQVFVGVDAEPGQQTVNTSPTVRLIRGSDISSLFVFNSSVVNLEAGHVNGVLDALDTSTVNITGGYARLLVAGSSSTVNLSGGYSISALAALSSTFNINGGVIGMGLTAQQDSTVNIRGGSIGFIPVSSGTFGGIKALGNSSINLFGTDLSSVLSDPSFFGLYSQYILAGHLLDGTDVTGMNINIANNSSASFTLNNVPAAAASGTIALEGLSALAAPQQVELTFRPTTGDPSFVRTVILNVHSAFTLSGIPRAHYVLHSKAGKYLASNLNLDLSGGDVSGIVVRLRAGDADNNNVVDIADLLLLIKAYNSNANVLGSRYDARADFNSDGVDDIADLLLLIRNYNKQGDE